MRRNLKEFRNVKQDGEDDDKHFVEFNVFICENRCFFELTIKTNSYVSLEAKKRKRLSIISIAFSNVFMQFVILLLFSLFSYLIRIVEYTDIITAICMQGRRY